MRVRFSLTSLCCATAFVSCASVAEYQSPVINISGFGSVVATHSNNDAGYMLSSKALDFNNKTLMGLQLSSEINQQTQMHFQLLSKGSRGFTPNLDIAYLEHQFANTASKVYLGNFRAPFFAYSEYLDVGYAYQTLNPNDALYSYVSFSGITGISLVSEYKIGSDMLTVQPFYGQAQIEDQGDYFGDVKVSDLFGLTASYQQARWQVYLSWAQGAVDESQEQYLIGSEARLWATGFSYHHQQHHFDLEVADYQQQGTNADVQVISATYGYELNQFTPYLSFSWLKSTDDAEREQLLPDFSELYAHKRITYALGLRYDVIENIAIKADFTYVDFKGTSGGSYTNIDLATGKVLFDSSTILSIALDFIF